VVDSDKQGVPIQPLATAVIFYALAWHPKGGPIAIGGYKETRLIDPATHKLIAILPNAADAVRALSFSRDGQFLAAAGGQPARKGEIQIWNVSTRQLASTIAGHSDCIYAIAYSPDSATIATASYDKLVKLWDARTGKEIRTLKDHIDAVYALAFTPDGRRLVSGAADRSVKIWDIATGIRLYTLSDATDGINTVAVSPDGRCMAAAGQDKTIRIWTLNEKDAKLDRSLIAHEDAILKLAWSPDGKYLASASADRTVKLFRAADLTEVHAYPNLPDWPQGLDFSPNSQTLAAALFNGDVKFYEVAR
jgi:WD40 repeat protein